MTERVKLFIQIRKKYNITAKMIAEKLRCKPQYISNIERGLCPLPAEVAVKMISLVKPKQERILVIKKMMLAFRDDYIHDIKTKGLTLEENESQREA